MEIERETKFYPVIHAHGIEHGINQSNIAINAGAKRVALIDQFCSIDDVYRIALELRNRFNDIGIIVNHLGKLDKHILLWLDNLRCDLWTDSTELNDYTRMPFSYGINGLHFGGIGFKYQNESSFEIGLRLGACAAIDSPRFIATTSGSATGVEPSPRKVELYKSVLRPNQRLAVASGMTAHNVSDFLPYASDFFIGTYIEDKNHCIIPERVTEMVGIIEK